MDRLKAIFDGMQGAAEAFQKVPGDMVFGEGDPCADIMLIGEAPGAEEVRQSRPFVGKAGRNLDEFLSVIGQKRSDIYITNVVKFRPFKTGSGGRLSNRPPSSGEIDCMLSYLLREIEDVSPKVVVTLGNVPLKCVLQNNKALIGAYHGKPIEAGTPSHKFILFPLYHPASIIYNPKLKEVYMQDLIKLKQYIESII